MQAEHTYLPKHITVKGRRGVLSTSDCFNHAEIHKSIEVTGKEVGGPPVVFVRFVSSRQPNEQRLQDPPARWAIPRVPARTTQRAWSAWQLSRNPGQRNGKAPTHERTRPL
jgi:hypothetical protein